MKTLVIMLGLILSLHHAQAMGGKGKGHERGEHFKKELGLSDEQLAKVKELRKGKKEELKEQRQKMKAAKEEFRNAMKNPKAAEDDLKAKFEAFQSARDSFQRARFAMMLQMRSILNPEQLEKFAKLKEERWGKGKGKRRE